MQSQITFYFKPNFSMTPQRSISVVGNISELGFWSDFKKHPLEKDSFSPENYVSKSALLLPIYTAFQYKMVVVEGNQIIHWENLPFNTNRSYTIQTFSITLKAVEGELPIKEIPFVMLAGDIEEEEDMIIDRFYSKKKNHKKKMYEEPLHSQVEITLENLQEKINEKPMNSSGSLNNLKKYGKKISRKNLKLYEKTTSERITMPKFKRKVESRPASETSISSMMVSSQSSRKDLNHYKDHKDFKEYNEEEKSLKRVGLQEMYHEMMLNTPNRLRGFSIIKSQNDIVYQITEDYIINLNYEEVVFIIMSYLPIKVSFNEKEKKWNIDFEPPSYEILKYISHFYSQAKNLYKKMIWVGMLYEEIPLESQASLKKYLFENYRCLVAFPSKKIHLNYIQYCYEYLDLILSNSFNLNNCSFDLLESFNSSYQAFRTINELLAELVCEKCKENPSIFILDYHLLLVNFYLVKKIVKPSIVFYYGISFPCFENFQLLQFNEEFMSSMLLGTIICFDDFSHARQFLSVVASVMGLKYEARRGDILIRYMGRQIKIKVNSIGLDTNYLDNVKKSNELNDKCKNLNKEYQGKNIIFSIDSMQKLGFLDVKLKLFVKLLEENPQLKDDTIFIQVINPSYWDLKTIESGIEAHQSAISNYLNKILKLQELLGPWGQIIVNLNEEFLKNEKFENILRGFQVRNIKTIDIYAMMSMAKLFIKTSVKNGNSVDLMEFLFLNETDGQTLFSDLISINPLFNKLNKFNPFSYEEFKTKIMNILNPIDKNLERSVLSGLESNSSISKKNTIITWLESLLYDLKKSILFAKHASLTKVEKLTSYDSVTYFKLATTDFFKYLNFKETLKNYVNSYNRIIIFDYEGTLVRSDQFADIPNQFSYFFPNYSIMLRPSEIILEALKLLCNDPRNSVYLITGKSPRELGPWILDIKNLNIFCEYGYLIRLKKAGNEWLRLYECNDWRWKGRGLEIMKNYVYNIQSSWIYEKESGIVWNYGEVCEELGWKQATLLEKQLKAELVNFKEIDIIRGRYYVEIRPYGINKVFSINIHKFFENLIFFINL